MKEILSKEQVAEMLDEQQCETGCEMCVSFSALAHSHELQRAEIERLNSHIQQIAESHQSNTESLLEVARERDAVTAELARVTKENAELRAAREQLNEVVEYRLTYETNLDGRGRPCEWQRVEYQWGDPLERALEILGIKPNSHPFRTKENFRSVVLERRSWYTTKASTWEVVDPAATSAAREGLKSADDAQGGAK